MSNTMTDSHGGITKRERYKWELVDRPGEFATIDKRQLRVDQSYQRKHSEGKINKMASEWSWVACGAISVALRDDGEWYVMDGQHRVLAALKRDDIREIPCMVFDVSEVAEEASGFLRANLNRKPMTMVDRFKALLMTEDHTARVVNELVLSSGRQVNSGGGTNHYFTAVQIMMNCVREDEQAMRRAWSVVVPLAEGKRLTQPMIAGFWYLERHMAPGESLASAKWKKRAIQVGYDEIMSSIVQTSIFYGGAQSLKNCALGVVRALNKGLRNKLEHTIKVDNPVE